MSSKTNNAPRQHGAMEHTDALCNLDAVRHYRLARLRQALASRDLAGIVLYAQVNTRYVTDSTNMQIWSTHNEVRYVYVPTRVRFGCSSSGATLCSAKGSPQSTRSARVFLFSTSCPESGRLERRRRGWRIWTR